MRDEKACKGLLMTFYFTHTTFTNWDAFQGKKLDIIRIKDG